MIYASKDFDFLEICGSKERSRFGPTSHVSLQIVRSFDMATIIASEHDEAGRQADI